VLRQKVQSAYGGYRSRLAIVFNFFFILGDSRLRL
jgi:hypothetical protein